MSTPNPFNFPVTLTDTGVQPTQPATILQQLLAAVAAQVPGYTASLPASLIEDVSSTDVAAIALTDSYRVELINSLTPFGANIFVLNALASIYGLQQGTTTNTTVSVVFAGTVGYVVPNGFLVSDGTNAYQVQGGGPINSGGSSSPMVAIALQSGATFAVPANTVTQLLTSVPGTITLSVNNPSAGTPGGTAETPSAFRARVLQAGLAASVGTSRYIKTLIGNLIGSQSNLVSVQVVTGVGLRIVVGGTASTYEIANAIFQSVADPSTLQGSAINSLRNVTVGLIDYPDTYEIVYVASPSQTVTMTITWNTDATGFTGGAAFPALVQPVIAAYINAIGIGQPINVLEMNELFQEAVADILDPSLLTRLVFSVSINSVVTAPGSGTYAITGDAESYFSCVPSGITIVQG
jgi:hypothetical protein